MSQYTHASIGKEDNKKGTDLFSRRETTTSETDNRLAGNGILNIYWD